jgi:hypothetical protein
MRGLLGTLVLFLALFGVAVLAEAPRVYAAPASLGTPDVECGPGGARVTFRWTPAERVSEQWLDVSTRNDNFAGSIRSAGPLSATTGSHQLDALRANTSHYWRVNSRTGEAWEASQTATFVPCPAQPGGAAAMVTDAIYTFGDDISEQDREKVRRAVTYAIQQAAPEGEFALPRVYAYSTPDQLAEAMATCVDETAALLGFRNLWLNTSTSTCCSAS